MDALDQEIKTQKDFDKIYLELRKRLLERILDGEMRFHLDYDRNEFGDKETVKPAKQLSFQESPDKSR